MSTRTKLFAAAAALGVLVLALSRGEEPTAQRRALEADRMATYVPPGGTLVDADAQNEGTSLGKPVSARYTRLFELAPGSAERALEHARAAAVAAGWAPLEPTPSSGFPEVFSADKRVPTGRLELGVTLFQDSRVLPDDVEPPALLVSLRHLGP